MRNRNDDAEFPRLDVFADMTEDVLAELGTGSVAYIRKLKAKDMKALFPQMPPVQDSTLLWVLLNANGTPILLSDSREAAVANAFEQDLKMVSVH